MHTQTGSANIFPISIEPAQKQYSRDNPSHHPLAFNFAPYSASIFEALWTNDVDGMRLTDEKGIIVAVNRAFCELVEMEKHELIGKPFTIIYSLPTDCDRLLSIYRMVFSTGMYQTIYELRPLLRTGKTLEVETFTACVESDRGNKLLLTQFRDNTERKKAESILRESESKYHGLFANSIQPMFESTRGGKILKANKSFLRLLGYQSFDEIVDLNIQRDVYIQADADFDLTTILETRGYIRNIELQLKRKNGNIITVVENARALHDEAGNMIGIEGVFEDITVKKNLEQQLHHSLQSLQKSRHHLTELNAQKSKLFSVIT
jgi:PAS domain S-box-containing protein